MLSSGMLTPQSYVVHNHLLIVIYFLYIIKACTLFLVSLLCIYALNLWLLVNTKNKRYWWCLVHVCMCLNDIVLGFVRIGRDPFLCLTLNCMHLKLLVMDAWQSDDQESKFWHGFVGRPWFDLKFPIIE